MLSYEFSENTRQVAANIAHDFNHAYRAYLEKKIDNDINDIDKMRVFLIYNELKDIFDK